VNHDNGCFYFHDVGSCIRRLDPRTLQVKAVVSALHSRQDLRDAGYVPRDEFLNQTYQSLVVAFDGYAFLTAMQKPYDSGRFASDFRVYGADGRDERAKVVAKIESVSTLALDDDRGILYVSTLKGQIFAFDVATYDSHRRERRARICLLFQLCAADERAAELHLQRGSRVSPYGYVPKFRGGSRRRSATPLSAASCQVFPATTPGLHITACPLHGL